jgi:uncharacterized protein (DUF111 family)
MKIAYVDSLNGISAGAFVGALLDAGLPFEDLERALRGLGIEGVALEAVTEERCGIYGTRFLVRVDQDQGPAAGAAGQEVIAGSDLPDRVKEIWARIAGMGAAKGEGASAPGPQGMVPLIEIVGAVLGLESLGIRSVFVSRPQEGVTPDGAALVEGLARGFGKMPRMTVERVGYGLGGQGSTQPAPFLRMVVGYAHPEQAPETVVVLETVLRDAHPERLGFLMDLLLEAGALDAAFCPVQIGRSRPGLRVLVLGRPQRKDELTRLLLQETGADRLFFHYSERRALERSQTAIESPWGRLKVKSVLRPNGETFLLPEYRVCRRIALDCGVPLRQIYAWVLSRKHP